MFIVCSMILTNKFKGKTVLIKQINFTDQYIFHKMKNIGIDKGSIIKILSYDKNKSVLHLEIHNVEYVMRVEDCKFIDVKEIK